MALLRGSSVSGLTAGCPIWVWKVRIWERIEVTECDIWNVPKQGWVTPGDVASAVPKPGFDSVS